MNMTEVDHRLNFSKLGRYWRNRPGLDFSANPCNIWEPCCTLKIGTGVVILF